MKKILYVSAEVAPYAKSGGLADVASSLPKAILKMGYDISIIMPKYKMVKEKLDYVMDFPIYMQGRKENCIIRRHEQKIEDKVLTTYFVDNTYYFDRDGMYCHPDEAERFAFFDKAVTEFIRIMKPNIVHLNDWQTGPIATLIRDKLYNNTIKIIYTIHNLEYNGRFNRGNIYHLDLDDSYFTPDKLEFYEDFSFTKAGIIYSDIVSTVSRTYADEIQTERYGFGYDGLLRMKKEEGKLFGIVNGIDYNEFNPAKDNELFKNYDSNNILFKYKNKVELREILGLPQKEVPLLAVISRVVHHKGFDVLVESLNQLLKYDIQFVILGVGEQHYINRFKYLKEKYPDKVSVNDVFDPVLAKRIYAGSDMFLMPSIFEPCGLSQLISFRYGTIPIARSTGGLKDTILNYLEDKENGNGFTFWGRRVEDLTYIVKKALEVYADKKEWTKIIKRAMEQDNSWKHAAMEYIELYK